MRIDPLSFRSYFVLRHHLLDVLNGNIRTNDTEQICHTHRMVASIVHRRRDGCHEAPAPLLLLLLRIGHIANAFAQTAGRTAQKDGTPVNGMIGLVQDHRPCHHERIVYDMAPGLRRRIDLHVEALVGAGNRVHIAAAARVAADEIGEDADGHMGPVVLLDDLCVQVKWETLSMAETYGSFVFNLHLHASRRAHQ